MMACSKALGKLLLGIAITQVKVFPVDVSGNCGGLLLFLVLAGEIKEEFSRRRLFPFPVPARPWPVLFHGD